MYVHSSTMSVNKIIRNYIFPTACSIIIVFWGVAQRKRNRMDIVHAAP